MEHHCDATRTEPVEIRFVGRRETTKSLWEDDADLAR